MTTPPLKSKSEEDASVSRSSVPSKYSDASPGKRPCARGQRCPTSNGDRFPFDIGNAGRDVVERRMQDDRVPIAIRSHGLSSVTVDAVVSCGMTPAVVAGITILGVIVPA